MSKFNNAPTKCKDPANCFPPKSSLKRAFDVSEMFKKKLNVHSIFINKVQLGFKKDEQITTFLISPTRVHNGRAVFYR